MSRPGYPKSETHEVRTTHHWVSEPNPTDPPGTQPVDTPQDFYDYYNSFYANRVGGNTPGWPTNKADNNYDAGYFRRHDQNCDYQAQLVHDNDHGYGQQSMVGITSGWSPGDDSPYDAQAVSTVYNRCLNKVITQIKGQKVHLGNFIAERRQLDRMVGDTATKLANTMFAIRRGNFRQAAHLLTGSDFVRGSRIPRGIPEQWLALKYGWQPLLSDIYGIAEELSNSLSDKPPLMTARASAQAESPGISFTIPSAGGQITWPTSEATRTGKVGGSLLVRFEMLDDRIQALSRTGMLNPLSVAWEVIPYSFVVDWFLPVGNYLNNLDYSAGFRFLGGWFAYKRSVTWAVKCNGGSLSDGYLTIDWSGGSIDIKADAVHREVFTDWPSVPLPHFKDPFSPTHAANGLALLATAFQRGRDSPTVWRR